jgi:hypothetical protein
MNIVVLGSCTDSSIIARELNKRLSKSLVVRVDLLKSIKSILLHNELETTKEIGTYIGDVEAFDFNMSAEKLDILKEKAEKLTEAIKSSKGSIYNTPKKSNSIILGTFDALTNSIPSSTYSFIKVYSGIVDDEGASLILNDSKLLSNSIVVYINNPKNQVFKFGISKEELAKLEKNSFAYVGISTAEDIFKTDVFKLILEFTNDTEKPIVEVENNKNGYKEPIRINTTVTEEILMTAA